MISVHDPDRRAALGELVRFRQELYGCLTARADALFELTDAVLCTEGPVRSLVDLSLAPEHRRGMADAAIEHREHHHREEPQRHGDGTEQERGRSVPPSALP